MNTDFIIAVLHFLREGQEGGIENGIDVLNSLSELIGTENIIKLVNVINDKEFYDACCEVGIDSEVYPRFGNSANRFQQGLLKIYYIMFRCNDEQFALFCSVLKHQVAVKGGI